MAKDIKVTQKTAWFMLHRLRHAARCQSFNRPLKGEVEADETFVGGKENNKHAPKKQIAGRGAVGKTPVMGVLERNGDLRTQKMESMEARGVQQMIRENVASGSTVMTNEFAGYTGLDRDDVHHTVNRGAGEYIRHYILHTNGIESAWALFKRQIIGVHRWVSEKHLGRYLSENTSPFNRREFGEGDRVNHLLAQVERCLMYKALIP